MSIKKAIQAEAERLHIPIQDNRTKKIYEIFDELFRLNPVEQKELDFEKQLFTRGTGKGRTGLHTSAIIASDNQYCMREQVLSLLYKGRNMNKTMATQTLRIFEEGNYVHRKWQRLFLRGGLCEVEDLDRTCYNDNYMLSFSPDAILTLKGRRFVVEIKSMNEFAYKKVSKHQGGEKQCRMYMFLNDIDYGIVLMENKNNQDFKLQVFDADETIIVEYIDRLEEIKACYENKEMPDRKDTCKTKLSKRCQECGQLNACWGSAEERKVLQLARG